MIMWHFSDMGQEHLTTILCGQNHESICMMQVVSSHLTRSGELFKGGRHCILEVKLKVLLALQEQKRWDCWCRSVFYRRPMQHGPHTFLKMPETSSMKNFIVFPFYKLLSDHNGKLGVEIRPS